MARIKVQGMGTFGQDFVDLVGAISRINAMALYDAAHIVADEIEAAVQALPVREDKEWGTEKHKLYGATKEEKEQLIEQLGIARFRKSPNTQNTSVGWTGYVWTPSTRFADHIPSGMLMQCIEYGTDFRRGTHTITAAMKRARSRAEQAIQNRIETETNKIMK